MKRFIELQNQQRDTERKVKKIESAQKKYVTQEQIYMETEGIRSRVSESLKASTIAVILSVIDMLVLLIIIALYIKKMM